MSPRATPATQNEGGCRQVPRLPRKWKVNVTKSHACHANGTSMSPSGTPATQSGAAPRATAPKCATRPSPVPQGPRLPRKGPGVRLNICVFLACTFDFGSLRALILRLILDRDR